MFISGLWTIESLKNALLTKIAHYASIINREKHYIEQWSLEEKIPQFQNQQKLVDEDIKTALKSIDFVTKLE